MGIFTAILMWILCPTFGEPFKACQSPQYLQYGKLGTVHCDLNDTFSAVFWYSSTNILFDEPVVTLTHSIKGGQGYKSGEFDINHDGSLLILDVDLVHEKNFSVAIFETLDGNPTIFIVSVVVTGITTDGCGSPQYLAYGRTGVVYCHFETTFESVFWYNSTHVLSDSPIVTYGNSGRGGRGYLSREFDVFSNGSLVINEVGLVHDTNFTVAKFSSLDEEPAYFVVRVIVTVNKLGGGPDIENCDDANATCYIELGRFSTIKCIVQGVRPAVALKWFSITDNKYRNISFDTEFIIDNITFTSVAATSDAFVYSPILSLLACKAEFPPGITQREESLVIVGNSDVNLSSIPAVIKYALLGSTIELKCSASNLLFLVWKRSFAFDSQYQSLISAFLSHNHFKTKRQDNYELERNGSLVLRQIEIEHDGFYCCVYGDGITNGITKYKVVTYVKPVPAYPVVEGCNFQHGCELAVESKGNLTCTMTGIRPEVKLKWKVSDETRSEEIFFDHKPKVMESGETFRITLTSSYSIPTSSQITVECGVSGSVSDIFPEYSVVKLIVISAQVKAADRSNPAVIIVICLMLMILVVLTLLIYGLLIKRKVPIQKKKQRRAYSTDADPMTSVDSSGLSETKGLTKKFVRQIKQTYKRLFNSVHPIPFIRDRLSGINTVIVHACMEKLDSSGSVEELNEGCQNRRQGAKGEGVWVKVDSYSSIIKGAAKNSTRFIVEGEPGYGKSTFSLQLAQDWCIDASYLDDVEILILLRLRQLKGVQSIYQAIQQFLLPWNSQITEDEIQSIIDKSYSLLIVLDGYDEYPVNDRYNENFLTNILKGDMFQDARVILTTSPSVLPNCCAPQTQRMRLVGFDNEAMDEYIRKAVVDDDDDATKNIKRRISENSTMNELCQIPFFFVIAVHMCQDVETFQTLKTITDFFEHMMSCFHKEGNRNLIHAEEYAKACVIISKEAFESLNGNNLPKYCLKERLLQRLGKDFYYQYVSAGILVEEEACNVGDTLISLESNHTHKVTIVRFYHHIFCEWYAAQHLEKMISKFLKFHRRSSGLGSAYSYNAIIKGENALCNKDIESLLNKIEPFHLQYIYRFACGRGIGSAVSITQYLQDKGYSKSFITLCIMEGIKKQGADEIVPRVVNRFLATDVIISNNDPVLQQKSTIELLEIASRREVPISNLRLIDSFQKVSLPKESIQLQSEYQLSPLVTLEKLEICPKEGKLTAEQFENILKYLSKCPRFKELVFSSCCFPDSFNLNTLKDFESRKINVLWSLSEGVNQLNYQTGKWKLVSPSKSESNASTTDTSTVSSSSREHKSKSELLRRNEKIPDFQTMPNAFRYLSSQLGIEWRSIGRQLGLEESTLEIMSTRHTSPQERIYLMLIHWKELKGTKASYKNLIKALREAGRKDLAEHLQNQQNLGRLSMPRRCPESSKKNNQKGRSRDGTTEMQKRKFHEESMELTLHYVSQSVQKEWLTVGRMLLLSEEELEKIKNDCTSRQEAIYRMLNRWKMQKGLSATYDVLANSLRGAGRDDLAEKLVRQGNGVNVGDADSGAKGSDGNQLAELELPLPEPLMADILTTSTSLPSSQIAEDQSCPSSVSSIPRNIEKLINPDVEVTEEDIDELADMVVTNSDYYEMKDTFVRRIIGYEMQRGLAIDIEREKTDPSTKLAQYIIQGWWKRTHSRKRSDLVARISKFNKTLDQEFIIYLNGLDLS